MMILRGFAEGERCDEDVFMSWEEVEATYDLYVDAEDAEDAGVEAADAKGAPVLILPPHRAPRGAFFNPRTLAQHRCLIRIKNIIKTHGSHT